MQNGFLICIHWLNNVKHTLRLWLYCKQTKECGEREREFPILRWHTDSTTKLSNPKNNRHPTMHTFVHTHIPILHTYICVCMFRISRKYSFLFAWIFECITQAFCYNFPAGCRFFFFSFSLLFYMSLTYLLKWCICCCCRCYCLSFICDLKCFWHRWQSLNSARNVGGNVEWKKM